ncbi:hypothetical protein L6R52_07380 [Myxococcota bacterium]|nr:hypothetical protein [Myxococcota bacterium]
MRRRQHRRARRLQRPVPHRARVVVLGAERPVHTAVWRRPRRRRRDLRRRERSDRRRL